MSYKAGIVNAIQDLGDRTGSSSIAIKKHMQARHPKDKEWQNATFLSSLKSGVASGDFVQNKNSYKLSADFKKKMGKVGKPKAKPSKVSKAKAKVSKAKKSEEKKKKKSATKKKVKAKTSAVKKKATKAKKSVKKAVASKKKAKKSTKSKGKK